MDREMIQKARQTNLAEYLMRMGVPLKREGNRHRHKEHDSLIFTKNAYYWNSRQEKGNAVDYLVRHMDMNFVNAVLALVSTVEQRPPQSIAPAKGFVLDSNSFNPDCQKAKIYLSQQRHIENNIIDYLIKNSLLLQEKQTNNIIFPMWDEKNNCVGAELQGVTPKRFKGIMKDSKYGYGFNIRFSNDGTFDYALFFESAVDLISFMDYKRNHQGKSFERCILVSMAGLKRNIVEHTLKLFKCDKVVLCVDNDEAGQIFKSEMERTNIGFIDCSPDIKYKDWNEQLAAVKRRSPPIGRLLVRGIEGKQGVNKQNAIESTSKTVDSNYEDKVETIKKIVDASNQIKIKPPAKIKKTVGLKEVEQLRLY